MVISMKRAVSVGELIVTVLTVISMGISVVLYVSTTKAKADEIERVVDNHRLMFNSVHQDLIELKTQSAKIGAQVDFLAKKEGYK